MQKDMVQGLIALAGGLNGNSQPIQQFLLPYTLSQVLRTQGKVVAVLRLAGALSVYDSFPGHVVLSLWLLSGAPGGLADLQAIDSLNNLLGFVHVRVHLPNSFNELLGVGPALTQLQ